MKNKNFKNKNKGFTILETLVAIFILVLSITGPLSFAQSGLRTSFLARDQITAFYLAQDAIEYIKNIRDTNGLSGVGWLTNIDNDSSGGSYVVDTLAGHGIGSIKSCDGICDRLDFNESIGYGYGIGNESIFNRTVYISEVNSHELEIVVEVVWESNPAIGERRVVVQENIFNWIPTNN